MCTNETTTSSWAQELFEERVMSVINPMLEGLAEALGVSLVLRTGSALSEQDDEDPKREDRQLSYPFVTFGLGEGRLEGIFSTRKEKEELSPLFNAVGACIVRLLDLGIGNHLFTRSSLHELHLSLAAAQGAAEFLLHRGLNVDSSGTSGRIGRNLLTVGDQLNLALTLSRNLISVYSLESSEKFSEPAKAKFDLSDELELLAGVWERIAKKRDIAIVCSFDERPILVLGDPLQLRQLFNNLLSNAVKYSYSTSERSHERFVSIRSYAYDPGFRQKRVAIHLSNLGVGIKEEELERLGEPGFRGEFAKTEQPVGLGIGVHVAQEIARMHGGEIQFKTKHLYNSEVRVRGQRYPTEAHKIDCTVILPAVE